VEQWAKRAQIKQRRVCSSHIGEQGERKLILALVRVKRLPGETLLSSRGKNADVEDSFVLGERPLGDKVAKRGHTSHVIPAMEVIAAKAQRELCRRGLFDSA
jgi:hypothetical protein